MALRSFVLLGLFASALTACASSGSGANPAAGPSPTPPPIACLPAVPAIAQLYPVPGATGVSAAFGQMIFTASNGAPLSNWQVRLVPNNGSAAILGGFLSTQYSLPGGPLPVLQLGFAYFGATVPLLSAATAYQVQVFMPALTCLAPLQTGTFTTQ